MRPSDCHSAGHRPRSASRPDAVWPETRAAVTLYSNRIFRTFGAGVIGRQEAKLAILCRCV
jgi:hypothetical protein